MVVVIVKEDYVKIPFFMQFVEMGYSKIELPDFLFDRAVSKEEALNKIDALIPIAESYDSEVAFGNETMEHFINQNISINEFIKLSSYLYQSDYSMFYMFTVYEFNYLEEKHYKFLEVILDEHILESAVNILLFNDGIHALVRILNPSMPSIIYDKLSKIIVDGENILSIFIDKILKEYYNKIICGILYREVLKYELNKIISIMENLHILMLQNNTNYNVQIEKIITFHRNIIISHRDIIMDRPFELRKDLQFTYLYLLEYIHTFWNNKYYNINVPDEKTIIMEILNSILAEKQMKKLENLIDKDNLFTYDNAAECCFRFNIKSL